MPYRRDENILFSVYSLEKNTLHAEVFKKCSLILGFVVGESCTPFVKSRLLRNIDNFLMNAETLKLYVVVNSFKLGYKKCMVFEC